VKCNPNEDLARPKIESQSGDECCPKPHPQSREKINKLGVSKSQSTPVHTSQGSCTVAISSGIGCKPISFIDMDETLKTWMKTYIFIQGV